MIVERRNRNINALRRQVPWLRSRDITSANSDADRLRRADGTART
jgi:hypothetical protein